MQPRCLVCVVCITYADRVHGGRNACRFVVVVVVKKKAKQKLYKGSSYKLVLQDTRYKVQDTRYKIQETRYKVQDTRYKRQGTT